MDRAKSLVHHQLPWWVHLCHSAWFVLRFFWGSIVLGLLLNTIASLIFLSQGTNLHTLFIGHMLDWVSQHAIFLGIVGGVMVVLTVFAGIGSRKKVSHMQQLALLTPAEREYIVAPRGNFIYKVCYKLRYFRFLARMHDSLDVSGLRRQPKQGIELLLVFIQLDLVNKPVQQTSADPIKPPDILQIGQKEIWDYLSTTRGHLVILGAPGSGKTTLLRYTTVSLAKRNHRALATSYRLPFLLFLRDHQDEIKNNTEFSLSEAIEKDLRKWGQGPPQGWVKHQLTSKRSLVLLDGLDEVADKATRRRVVEWVQRQIVANDSCRFVVTSRRHGYYGNELSNAIILEVQSFTSDQIARFIKQWYLVRENAAVGRQDERERRGRHAQDQAENLTRRLRRKPALRKLAANPLLLTMIALVHSSNLTLPENRVELYKEVCEVFLGRREEARNLTLRLTPSQQQWILEHLAYHLMLQKAVIMTEEKVVEIITKPLAEVDTKLLPKEFLRLVEDRGGLFLEKEQNIYGFTHKAFQEYLTAVYIGRYGLVQDLVSRVNDEWWRETILLYCAQNDATLLIEACLEITPPTIAAYRLAVECRDMFHHVQPEVRAQLDELTNQEIEDNDPIKQQTMAEALLDLRLSNDQLIPLSENEDVFISPSFISCMEYQLFIDEQQADGTVLVSVPDHWKELHFPSGHGQLPILGLRPSDANAFCAWLSTPERSSWKYRLPAENRLELDEVCTQLISSKELAQGCGFWLLSGRKLCWPKEEGTKLKKGAFQERLAQDYHQLASSQQVIKVGDIATCLSAIHKLKEIRSIHTDLVRTLLYVREMLSDSERELQIAHAQVKNDLSNLESKRSRVRHKLTSLRAELAEALPNSLANQRNEDSNLLSTINKQRIDHLTQQKSQLRSELINVQREKAVIEDAIKREERRWFSRKRRLKELQGQYLAVSDQETQLVGRQAQTQRELEQATKQLERNIERATRSKASRETTGTRIKTINDQLAVLGKQEEMIAKDLKRSHEQQVVNQQQLTLLGDRLHALSYLCDDVLAFAQSFSCDQLLITTIDRNLALSFDVVLAKPTQRTISTALVSFIELIDAHIHTLSSTITEFATSCSSEVDKQSFSKLIQLTNKLMYIVDAGVFQQQVKSLANTLFSFCVELSTYRPLGRSDPLLRATIRYIAWEIGENLSYFQPKKQETASQQHRRSDQKDMIIQSVLEAYLNISLSLVILEERIEGKLLPVEGIVLIGERREQIQQDAR